VCVNGWPASTMNILDIIRACCWRLLEWLFNDEPEEDLMIEADRPPVSTPDEQLKQYAELDKTENGKTCLLLYALANSEGYLSDKFYLSLTREIETQLHLYLSKSENK